MIFSCFASCGAFISVCVTEGCGSLFGGTVLPCSIIKMKLVGYFFFKIVLLKKFQAIFTLINSLITIHTSFAIFKIQ